MTVFECRMFRASAPRTPVGGSYMYHVTRSEIGIYGDLYTGNLIRSLGVHYNDYVQATAGRLVWRIQNRYGGSSVGRVKVHSEKHKSQAVTGNIGEAVVMPALAHAMSYPRMPFQRMKAHGLRCPDFRIGCDWSRIDTLWRTSLAASPGRTLPDDMPVEVKTHLGRDEGYLLDAVEQLLKYWQECDAVGYPEAAGYGIIARVDLDVQRNPGTGTHFIRYVLFAPNRYFTLTKLERIIALTKTAKFKSYKRERRLAFIFRTIGRYFE